MKTSAFIINWLIIEEDFQKIKSDTSLIALQLKKIFLKNGKLNDYAQAHFKNFEYVCEKLTQFTIDSLLEDKTLGIVPGNINVMGFSPIRMELSRIEEIITNHITACTDEIAKLEKSSIQKMLSKKTIEEYRTQLNDSKQVISLMKRIGATMEDIYLKISQDINTVLIQYINGIRTVVKDIECSKNNLAHIMVKLNLSIEMLQMNSKISSDFSLINLLLTVGRIKKVEDFLMSIIIPKEDFDEDYIINISANKVINRYLLNLKQHFDEKIDLFLTDIETLISQDTRTFLPNLNHSAMIVQTVNYLIQKEIITIPTLRIREMTSHQASMVSGYEFIPLLLMNSEADELALKVYYYSSDDGTLYFTVKE